MREIKFRVWCPTSKHFSTQPWLSCDGLMLKWEHTGDLQTLTDIRFDNYVIQQYTGLKDKNGKEIYEGDILKIEWRIDSIDSDYYYDDVTFSKSLGMWSPHAVLTSDDTPCEIIGNIFENTDLMGTKFYLYKR